MSVTNGQLANQTTFNNAFMSRTVDTSTIGRVDLNNGLAASGGAVVNVQRELNSVFSFTGRVPGSAFDATPNYASNEVVQDTDALDAAVGKLDALFNNAAGHEHSGAAGDGAPIKRPNVVGVSHDDGSTGNIDALASAGYSQIRLVGASPITLRGIADGATQRQLTIMNLSGGDLLVKDQHATPTAVNRIITGTGSDVTIKDGGTLSVEYDVTAQRWRVVGGPGGDTIVAFQEMATGVVDGSNDTFGLSVLPVNDDSVLVFVDGVERDQVTHYTVSGSTITFEAGSIPELGQTVYAFYLYKQSGGVAPGVGTNGSPKSEFVTLDGTMVAAKQFTLAQVPLVPSEILVDIGDGGGPQFYGVDYTVSGAVVSWSGLVLDGLVAIGDKFRVHYYY